MHGLLRFPTTMCSRPPNVQPHLPCTVTAAAPAACNKPTTSCTFILEALSPSRIFTVSGSGTWEAMPLTCRRGAAGCS